MLRCSIDRQPCLFFIVSETQPINKVEPWKTQGLRYKRRHTWERKKRNMQRTVDMLLIGSGWVHIMPASFLFLSGPQSDSSNGNGDSQRCIWNNSHEPPAMYIHESVTSLPANPFIHSLKRKKSLSTYILHPAWCPDIETTQTNKDKDQHRPLLGQDIRHRIGYHCPHPTYRTWKSFLNKGS